MTKARVRHLFTLVPFLVAFTVHGCQSPDKKPARQDSEPALHAAHGVPPSTPSGDARLMEGMGKVDFAITTKSAEAQAFFNQGVAQLYGFWFTEAERSFARAAKLDPGAAMAYWGIAMSAPGNFVPMYQLVSGPNQRLPAVAPPKSGEALARDAI